MQNVTKYKTTGTAIKSRIKSIAVFAVCLLLLLSNFIFFRATTASADDTPKSNNRTVTACIFRFDGYHMKDDQGFLTGYGIDFLNYVSEYSHLNFKYAWYKEGWNWGKVDENGNIEEGSILDMLVSGKINVVTSVSKTPAREKYCDFSLPIGRKKTVLSVRENDETRRRGDYSTYQNMKIGLLSGNAGSQNPLLEEFAKDKP